jgi:hypothetical protein
MYLKSISNAENVMLLKALQFDPKYLYIMTWDKDYVDGTKNGLAFSHMLDIINEYGSDDEKPLCNIVIYLTGDEEPDRGDWWGMLYALSAVSNGISASGYRTITSPEPIPNARHVLHPHPRCIGKVG